MFRLSFKNYFVFSLIGTTCISAVTACGVLFTNPKRLIQGAVFGQPDFTTRQELRGYNTPVNVLKVGQKLAVAEYRIDRVLLYNSYSALTQSGSAVVPVPDVVLGQNDANTVSNSSPVSAQTLFRPHGLASDGTRLLIGDAANNRVLIWNSWPTQNRQAADVVIGQANFSSNSSACSATGLKTPAQIWVGTGVDAGVLYIADSGNNRVLVYNSIPTTNGATPDYVIGQVSLNTCGAANSATGLNIPRAVYSQGSNLLIGGVNRATFILSPYQQAPPLLFECWVKRC